MGLVRRLDELMRDCRTAWVGLKRAPGVAMFCIASVALGLGSVLAIYSVIDAVVYSKPAVVRIAELVNVYRQDPRTMLTSGDAVGFSVREVDRLRALPSPFVDLTAWFPVRVSASRAGISERVRAEMVDGAYFRTLGVTAAVGRVIQSADDLSSADPVAVLSDNAWRRWFDRDPNAVGMTLRVGPTVVTVVGVVATPFKGVNAPAILPTEIWLPLSLSKSVAGVDIDGEHEQRLQVRARLREGTSAVSASAQVAAVGQQSSADAGGTPAAGWVAVSMTDIHLHESVHAVARPVSAAILVAMIAVLAVACSNVGVVLLARGQARRHERAVRLAVGASRWQIIQSEMAYSMLILAGGVAGALLIGWAFGQTVVASAWQVSPGINVQFSFEPGVRVFVMGVVATIVSFGIFGLLPALQLSRVSIARVLASDNPVAAGVGWRGRGMVIAAQVAVSVVLVLVGVLSTARIYQAALRDPGFGIDRLAVVRLDLPLSNDVEGMANRERVQSVMRRASDMMGGGDLALATGLPVGMLPRSFEIEAAGGDGSTGLRVARVIGASPTLLSVLGVALVEGRSFSIRDSADASRVVILSRATALTLFGTQHAIGRTVWLRGRARTTGGSSSPVIAQVIGIAADTDVIQIGRRTGALLAYAPLAQHEADQVLIAARGPEPEALAARLADHVRALDAGIVITDQGAATALADPTTAPLRLTAMMASNIGVVTLLLAMVGLYGALSLNVSARLHEIGVRMAIGATPLRVLRMVLGDGLTPVGVGMMVGLLAAYPVANASMMLMSDARVGGVVWVVSVATAVVVCALAACIIPARKAASLNVAEIVRHST